MIIIITPTTIIIIIIIVFIISVNAEISLLIVLPNSEVEYPPLSSELYLSFVVCILTGVLIICLATVTWENYR